MKTKEFIHFLMGFPDYVEIEQGMCYYFNEDKIKDLTLFNLDDNLNPYPDENLKDKTKIKHIIIWGVE